MRHEDEKLIEVTVEVGAYQRSQEEEIKRACMIEWAFRKQDFFLKPAQDRRKRLMEASALGVLYRDDDVDDLVGRIERAVWRANGEMCHVDVKTAELIRPREWQKPMESDLLIA